MNTRMNIVLVLASVMTGGVFAMDATDGLVGWWRVNPAAGGAVFNAADLRDDAHAGVTATAVNHQAEDGAYPAVPICHQNVDVTYMAHGKLTAAPCIYFPKPTNYTAEGVCVANRQNVVVPVGDVDIAQGDACTFMIRMKYRGSVSANASGCQDYKAFVDLTITTGRCAAGAFACALTV